MPMAPWLRLLLLCYAADAAACFVLRIVDAAACHAMLRYAYRRHAATMPAHTLCLQRHDVMLILLLAAMICYASPHS